MRRVALALAVVGLVLVAQLGRAEPPAGWLYWTDSEYYTVSRVSLGGGSPELLADYSSQYAAPRAIAVDTVRERITYGLLEQGSTYLVTANLDGSDSVRHSFPSSLTYGINAIALDESRGYVYWTDPHHRQIVRTNTDATGPSILLVTGKALREPSSLAWDPVSGRLYWSARAAIFSADPDESTWLLLQDSLDAQAIAVAPNRRLYWIAGWPDRTVWSSLPDGSDSKRHFVTGWDPAYGIAIDPARNRLYWTASVGLFAADSDGSDLTLVATGDAPHGLALAAGGEQIYWTDWAARTVNRVDTAGGEPPVVLARTGAFLPRGVAVDESAGRVIWGGDGDGQLWTAPLSGGAAAPFVAGQGETAGVALDAAGSRLFWLNYTGRRVWTANADGSNPHVLYGGDYNAPAAVALDRVSGYLYWADVDKNAILRVRPGSLDVETVVTSGLEIPTGLAVDPVHGKLYWADWGTVQIGRANLDGSQVEVLLDATDGLALPNRIALDQHAGKLYWTDFGRGTISRANLDGSNTETIVSGLGEPDGVAIDRSPVGAYRVAVPLAISQP